MSRSLISRSPDLKQLEDEGYEIEIWDVYLILKGVPYVTKDKTVQFGSLVSDLNLAGNKTATPHNHVVMFAGEMPCDEDGSILTAIQHSSQDHDLGGGLTVNHSFSSKPKEGYANYHQKMTTYVSIISTPAQSIEPNANARPFAALQDKSEHSVFEYPETASSRAGIRATTEKLRIEAVAIIGLGGTGSYILDFLAKTPVQEIHLFDGDRFGNHNAFRSPGAPSIDELAAAPMKAEYFRDIYSEMRKSIFAYGCLDESNVHLLTEMTFVFVAVDKGSSRQFIAEHLSEFGVPFIDVGMGIQEVDGSLVGQLRVTTSNNQSREKALSMLTHFGDDDENDYSRNIQIAELNALNAALAVVKWKKLFEFYTDLQYEYQSLYGIGGNKILSRVICD